MAVGRDLAALAAWSRRYRSTLSEVGSAVNDTYLRAQGQAAGVASYGRMVDLLIAERRIRMRRAPLRVSRHQAQGPGVNPSPRDSGNATLRAPFEGSRVFLHPAPESPSFASLAPPAADALLLLVGPAGGWEPAELERVQGAGFCAASLGPRVLRAETAAISAVVAAQLLWGDLA